MRTATNTLTMKEYDVQSRYFIDISKENKKAYKKSDIKKQREILNEFNGEPIEYFAEVSELIAQKEYLEKLDRAGKKAYKKKSSFEQHEIIQKYMDEKSKPFKVKTIPEPELYDVEDIVKRDNSIRLEDRHKVLSPGEIKIAKAMSSMGMDRAEVREALEELERKNPTKKITYDYKEIEPNYYNQQFFDKIEELYKNVDYENLSLPEQLELDARSHYWQREILVSQPTKATPKKSTSTRAKKILS